ncbi:MAG: anti-sigma28 factor (negative regulator of flagellin synthesis) [Kiritimatiellia bacterium]|jgi:anti-sigma28 factor (negative regulator of flagellin synthesis)
MKINLTQRAQPQVPELEAQTRARVQPQQASGLAATTVQRSSFMTSLRDAQPAGVRHDLVNDVKAALADGTFEASVNLDDVIDSLLADL